MDLVGVGVGSKQRISSIMCERDQDVQDQELPTGTWVQAYQYIKSRAPWFEQQSPCSSGALL